MRYPLLPYPEIVFQSTQPEFHIRAIGEGSALREEICFVQKWQTLSMTIISFELLFIITNHIIKKENNWKGHWARSNWPDFFWHISRAKFTIIYGLFIWVDRLLYSIQFATSFNGYKCNLILWFNYF